MRVVVSARKDGRGLVTPFIDDINRKGQPFYVGGLPLKITKDNRVYIPKKIMDKYGTLINGRRMLVLETGATYETPQSGVSYVKESKTAKKLLQGADILKGENIDKFLTGANTGDRVPDNVVYSEDLQILKAKDTTDLYIG